METRTPGSGLPTPTIRSPGPAACNAAPVATPDLAPGPSTRSASATGSSSGVVVVITGASVMP